MIKYKSAMMIISLFLPFFPAFSQDQYSYRGFDAPVSVVQYGGYYYLSNAGKNKNRSAKDGDGYISRLKSDGSQEEVTLKYISGLDSPHGIFALQGVLYVCDVDRLAGFDLKSKKKVFELSFAGEKTVQLSGIACADNKTMYVSASDIHAVFEVDLAGKTYKKWMETTAPNSLLIDRDKMYVCSWGIDSLPNGKLGVIDMKKKTYRQLGNCEGYLWGLALDGKKLYFCDWVAFAKRGVIRWYHLDTGSSGQIKLTSKMGGPADFIYDAHNDLFIIPAVLEGLVYGALGFKQRTL
ncbi:MAG: hypothetical protein LBR08_08815 [Bacteroidales bacterium]|jgi:hypothetical protein|nr:hypothetical protein [Bacteroidales bacterium]